MSAAARQLPAAEDVKFGQAKGWDCIWCGQRLTSGAVSVGRIAEERAGLNFEVWACPACARASHGAQAECNNASDVHVHGPRATGHSLATGVTSSDAT